MKHDFWAGKDILITGTSSGIGKALVELLADKPCRIFSVSRTISAPEEGRSPSLETHQVIPIKCDISNPDEIKKLKIQIGKFTDKLDILINNAGITAHGRFDETDIRVFHKIFSTNFFGSIYLTQLMLDLLKKSTGIVMTVSTVSGFYGIPGRSAYSASKAALHSAFEAFGIEMIDQGVKSVVVCPPYTKTGLRTSGLDKAGKQLNEAQHKGKILLPNDVAKYMLDVLEKGKTGNITMDFSGRFVKWMRTLAPSLLNKILYKKLYHDFH